MSTDGPLRHSVFLLLLIGGVAEAREMDRPAGTSTWRKWPKAAKEFNGPHHGGNPCLDRLQIRAPGVIEATGADSFAQGPRRIQISQRFEANPGHSTPGPRGQSSTEPITSKPVVRGLHSHRLPGREGLPFTPTIDAQMEAMAKLKKTWANRRPRRASSPPANFHMNEALLKAPIRARDDFPGGGRAAKHLVPQCQARIKRQRRAKQRVEGEQGDQNGGSRAFGANGELLAT